MARILNKLNDAKLKGLKEPGLYSDGGGLFLQVTTASARSWVYRFQLHGRRRDMGLGSLTDIGLAAARNLARDARELVAKGSDPIVVREAAVAAQRLAEAQAVTFEDFAEDYVADHEKGWSNPKHRAQWRSTLKQHVYPVLGKEPVQSIDTDLVLKVLEPLWKKRPETGSRVRGRIEAILNAAKAKGYRTGENPAAWRAHLDQVLPARKKAQTVRHQPSVPFAELPALMARLKTMDSISAKALRFTILTCARTCETIGATWPEFDEEGALWTVPASRMKARKIHRVGLSEPALAIVKEMSKAKISKYVFPGWKKRAPLSEMALLQCLRGLKSGYTVHGFRATFKTWATEKTAFPDYLSEMALAHVSADRVRDAYARGELLAKRIELAEAWADFCEGVVCG
jgi:integrase